MQCDLTEAEESRPPSPHTSFPPTPSFPFSSSTPKKIFFPYWPSDRLKCPPARTLFIAWGYSLVSRLLEAPGLGSAKDSSIPEVRFKVILG